MAATLHDVARRAGVSIKTVSNVIHDHPHVRAETRERVREAIAALDYTPNLTARGLRSGRTGAIGLAVPDLGLSYFAELAAGTIEAAERAGVVVLVEQTGGHRDRELALLRSPRRKLTDGLLFSPLGMTADDVGALRTPYPMVVLGERIFGGPADHVTMRNVAAARAATQHLIDLGRRRIAVIGAHAGDVDGSPGLRLRGYREALDAAAIRFDPELIRPAPIWQRANGAAVVRALIADGVPFDAVFGLNDTLALGAMRALSEEGIGVPGRVAVVGFDDLDESQYAVPSLTTIDPGREWLPQAAVSTLLERISGDYAGAPRLLEAEYRLVVRESAPATGAHPT
ncbi:MAG: LacI family DNA-binding transcriptional regulator [Microbacterium sp.]|nr:LacI family DNA-binding transcriptional regulator [Microbacterium sp.]